MTLRRQAWACRWQLVSFVLLLGIVLSLTAVTRGQITANREKITASRATLCDLGRLVGVSSVSKADPLPGETPAQTIYRVALADAFLRGWTRLDCQGEGFTAR